MSPLLIIVTLSSLYFNPLHLREYTGDGTWIWEIFIPEIAPILVIGEGKENSWNNQMFFHQFRQHSSIVPYVHECLEWINGRNIKWLARLNHVWKHEDDMMHDAVCRQSLYFSEISNMANEKSALALDHLLNVINIRLCNCPREPKILSQIRSQPIQSFYFIDFRVFCDIMVLLKTAPFFNSSVIHALNFRDKKYPQF